MELVQDRSGAGLATLKQVAGSFQWRICDVWQAPGSLQGKIRDVEQVRGSFGGMSVAGIGFATSQGRHGVLLGSEKCTFCCMERSSCRHRSPPKTSETLGPEALL